MKFPFVVFIFLIAFILFLVVLNVMFNVVKQTKQGQNATGKKGNGRFAWLGEIKAGIGSRVIWSILLIIAGAVVLYCGIYSAKWKTPSLASVWNWSWGHWFWILIMWGVFAALVALLCAGKTRETLQNLLIIVVVGLLVGVPFISWIESPGSPGQQKVAGIRTLMMPANGDSAHISEPVGYTTTFTGDKFSTHAVYANGYKCTVGDPKHPCVEGPILFEYVHDKSGKPNSVTYEFVKK